MLQVWVLDDVSFNKAMDHDAPNTFDKIELLLLVTSETGVLVDVFDCQTNCNHSISFDLVSFRSGVRRTLLELGFLNMVFNVGVDHGVDDVISADSCSLLELSQCWTSINALVLNVSENVSICFDLVSLCSGVRRVLAN